MNRATALLQALEQRATTRAQWAVLALFLGTLPALLATGLLGLPGLLSGLLLLGALALRTMAVVQRAIAGAIGETAALYAVVGRVVEFQVAAWRIVGAE